MKHWHRWLTGGLAVATLAVVLALVAPLGRDSLAAGATIYVDVDAAGLNNGTSWLNAYTDLQLALAAAVATDEIWVAEGTYRPTSGSDRLKSFKMKNGVALYGGFAGTETSRGQRDWVLHKTILSGDIGIPGDASDNSYHVFYHPENTNLDSTAILDGFTISGGNASTPGWPHFAGGGMFNWDSSPTLNNCTFAGNRVYEYGGGMYNYEDSSPHLTNCTFYDNLADVGGGMHNGSNCSPQLTNSTFFSNTAVYGAGMWNINYLPTPTEPILINTTFISNTATWDGGGMYNNTGSTPVLTDCTFVGNSAGEQGGGMFNYNSSPALTDCAFLGNSADLEGGGMFNRNASSPVLANCTFWDNSAGSYGGGIFNLGASAALTNCTFWGNSADAEGGAMYSGVGSSGALTNCILWRDTPEEIFRYDVAASPVITHSDVQGGYPGDGNIDDDPLFVDPDHGDLHLGPCSPAVDKGDNSAPHLPALDFEGDARILDGDGNGTATVDMGVDEVTVVGDCERLYVYLPLVLTGY